LKPRDEFVLATKVGRLLRADAPPDPSQSYKGVPPVNPIFDFSYDGVMRSVEESLDRLGLDRIDILHIHDPDEHFSEAVAGAYRALDRLRSEGSIKAVGAGMNQAEMLVRFAREANFDCFLLAGRYTLLDRRGAVELLPLCVKRGIAIIAGGVFNSGILADPTPGTTFDYRPAPAELVQRAAYLKSVCAGQGVELKAAAIQFPLRHPAVASVLTGCRSVAEVEENVRMFHAPIPHALWQQLDA
jgi:D-threo-aldose 1-dehydrogenase